MQKRSTIFFFVLIILAHCVSAQKLVQITDETLTVNSTTAMSGYTRNKTEVILPEKTKSYIYRLSIAPKGHGASDNSLFDLLKQVGGANVAMASSFAQFAIHNNDNSAVDAFIFDNVYDADNFFGKKDGNWSACKSMPNRVSCCFSTEQCIGRRIFFGFRNNNVMQGLDVRLEVVAVVDSSLQSAYKYSYTIHNSGDQELKYLISLDNVNWEQTNLRPGYQQTLSFEQREIYFRINSGNNKFSSYRLTPDERYKIFWNSNSAKWDLIRY